MASGNPYVVGPFYSSIDNVKDQVFKALSLTSQFKVSLFLSVGNGSITNAKQGDRTLLNHLDSCGLLKDNSDLLKYDFLCSEAVLPGSTFDMAEEYGSRQGIIERFPTRRIYSDFNLTFYVDRDYSLIRLFEEWMNFIDPLYAKNGNQILQYQGSSAGQAGNYYLDSNDFYRFKYPNTYKKLIGITKFERDYVDPNGNLKDVPSLTYQFVDAFPTNLTALPLSYEGSTITKTTVNFSYSRYVVMKHNVPLQNEKDVYSSTNVVGTGGAQQQSQQQSNTAATPSPTDFKYVYDVGPPTEAWWQRNRPELPYLYGTQWWDGLF